MSLNVLASNSVQFHALRSYFVLLPPINELRDNERYQRLNSVPKEVVLSANYGELECVSPINDSLMVNNSLRYQDISALEMHNFASTLSKSNHQEQD
jgi:hypothetical protein